MSVHIARILVANPSRSLLQKPIGPTLTRMTDSYSRPLNRITENATPKNASLTNAKLLSRIQQELSKLINLGYKRRHLTPTPENHLVINTERIDHDALRKALNETKKTSKKSKPDLFA